MLFRSDLGISQVKLAESLGVSRSAVARWEADAFRPTKLVGGILLGFAASARVTQGTFGLQGDSSSVEPHVRTLKRCDERRPDDTSTPEIPAT